MRIVTRVVLEPQGDGGRVEIFDSEAGDLDRTMFSRATSPGPANRTTSPTPRSRTCQNGLRGPGTDGGSRSARRLRDAAHPMIPDPIHGGREAGSLQSMFIFQA